MRATSPLDALGPTQAFEPIPQPTLPVGTRLDLTKVASYNRPYYIRRIRQELIRRLRKTIDRMRVDGYFPEMVGNKLLPCHKEQLRAKFHFMETADGVFVAGHAPSEAQSHDNIANQCYLVGCPGFGGMSYHCYVMFRKLVNGNQLIYTLPFSLLGEDDAKNCVVRPPADPQLTEASPQVCAG
mgnify:CR=1 FL=1